MKINVSHVAKLANLPLTDKEIKQFEPQLEEALNYIEVLNEVDTKTVAPTSNLTGLTNVVDDDVVRPSLSQKEVVTNSKEKHHGLFKVKGILENE